MDIENKLVENLSMHPGVWVYYNLAFANGQFGNLVILENEYAADHWKNDVTHQIAANDQTPKHYRSVRLHNGQITPNKHHAPKMTLTRTKYYDFKGTQPWFGIREFTV